MVTTIVIGDVLEARFEGIHQPTLRRWNNVRHYEVTAPFTTTDTDFDNLVAMGELLYDAYAAAFLPLLSNTLRLDMVRLKRVAPAASVFAMYTDLAVGAVAQPVDEPDDAVVISLYTNLPGRQAQGRMYLPGIPQSVVGNGLIDVGTADDIAAAAFGLFTGSKAVQGGSVVPVVFSKTRYAENPILALSTSEIVRVTVDQVVRRMTSRDIQLRAPVSPQ